jgi:hypothetical protein
LRNAGLQKEIPEILLKVFYNTSSSTQDSGGSDYTKNKQGGVFKLDKQ